MARVRTQVVEVNPQEPEPEVVERTAGVLRQGGLVVVPTDTVYGLVCDPGRREAVERIYRVKQRRREMPLALLLHDASQVSDYVSHLPEAAARAMQHFWPGALTVVVRERGEATATVRARGDTVGLRLPAHLVPRAVSEAVGCPLASTSANRSGGRAPVTAAEVCEDLEGLVELVLDAGRTPLGEESTVVSFAESPPRVLRLGAIGLGRLREVLGEVRAK